MKISVNKTPVGKKIFVKISHYTPWVGGVNCARFVNGKCVSKMASGLPWENYIDKAIACPKELPFHSKITLDGKTWECLDRGGKIIFDGKVYWIDLLTAKTTYPFGSIKEAYLVLP